MATGTRLRGWMTALVTPFKDGAVDEAAFRALIDWQIESGIAGLVPVGTTGESPTLSHDEHKRIVEIAVAEAGGRVPVIAGAGSNNTREAVELAVHAEKAGADAVLVVTPYYNKPNQEGLFQHFKAIDAAIGIPIIIYNIPPRSVIDMSVETMKRCHGELRHIAGVKDATGNVARISLQRQAMGPDFLQFSGDDMTALACFAAGAVGCISVVSNVRAAPLRRTCGRRRPAAISPRRWPSRTSWCPCTPRPSSKPASPAPRPASACSAARARRCACLWCPRPTRRARPSARRWSTPASSPAENARSGALRR